MRISLYDFGKITVDGAPFTRDVIIGPGGVDSPWWRKEGHNLAPQDLDAVWRQRPDVLVVGTGYHGRMRVPEETARWVREQGVDLIALPTTEAVERFNALDAKGEGTVVAAFHLTC